MSSPHGRRVPDAWMHGVNRSRTAWAAVSRHSLPDGPTKDETIGAHAMFPPSSVQPTIEAIAGSLFDQMLPYLHGYSLTTVALDRVL
jgi:hypothetical protein